MPSFLRVLAFVLAVLVAGSSSSKPLATDGTLHVLFLGNSLTYYNAMPASFARLVEQAHPGLKVDAEYVAGDGVTLEDLWASKWVSSTLAAKHWDVVVLQEQGGLASATYQGKTAQQPPTSFFSYTKRFADKVQAAGSRTVLYETHPAREDNFPYIDHAYIAAANQTASLLSPVGRVVDTLGREDSLKDKLSGADGHPSVLGSCVAAATLASTITGDAVDASGCTGSSIDTARINKAIRDVFADLGPGPYRAAPAPSFSPTPTIKPASPMGFAQLAGAWEAREDGVPLSFGMRWRFVETNGLPRLVVRRFGANAVTSMPVHDLRIANDVLTFSTNGDNRALTFALALQDGALVGVVESRVGAIANYVDVRFRRPVPSDRYFDTLERIDARFRSDIRRDGFDDALLKRYEALEQALGVETVDKITMGGPLSDGALTMLTSMDYAAAKDDDAALAYARFSAAHFPSSPFAHAALSVALEAKGRIREAYRECCLADELFKKSDPSAIDLDIGWQKTHLSTLLEAR